MPLLSAGLLAAVPPAHAAMKTGDRKLWSWVAIYGVLTVIAWTLLGSDPSTNDPSAAIGWQSDVGTAIVLFLVVAGTLHAFRLRPLVFDSGDGQSLGHPDPAVRRALAARARRAAARRQAEEDPGIARDLRIGRPDLPRDYDDGGLVDVNHVPAVVLAHELELTPAEVEMVLFAREKIGAFGGVEEMCAFSGLPPQRLDVVVDRLIFL